MKEYLLTPLLFDFIKKMTSLTLHGYYHWASLLDLSYPSKKKQLNLSMDIIDLVKKIFFKYQVLADYRLSENLIFCKFVGSYFRIDYNLKLYKERVTQTKHNKQSSNSIVNFT